MLKYLYCQMMMQLEVLRVPLDGMLVHHKDIPNSTSLLPMHLNSKLEEESVKQRDQFKFLGNFLSTPPLS